MKNPEEAIERVLAALREVETPRGMERRVLEAAQARVHARKGWKVAAMLGARPWAVATAALVLVAMGASVALHRHAQIRYEVAGRMPHPRAEPPTPVVHLEARTSWLRRGKAATPRRIDATVARPEPLNAEDALALSEMNAPSHPAPPMPLTEQEKELLKLLHRGDRVQLAMLDPKIFDGELATSKGQFEEFFAKPKADEAKPGTEPIKPATADSK